MSLTRRTQVLLDDERYEAVRQQAEADGVSVGSVIRNAIDAAMAANADHQAARQRAGTSFLEAEPMEVDEWDVIEAEIEEDQVWSAEGSSPSRPTR